MRIGRDVLKVGRRIVPDKVNLTIKMPHPIDFVLLSAEWEKDAGRRLTDEERVEWKSEEFGMWVADQIEAQRKGNGLGSSGESRQIANPIMRRRTPFKTRRPRFI